MEIFWGRSAERAHEPPLAHNLISLWAWSQPPAHARMGWPGLRLLAWAEKQQSREDDRFALEKHRRPPPCMLTGLIGRHRRCMETWLAGTGLPGLYHDDYARKRACSTPSHLTTEASVRTTGQRHSRSVVEPLRPCVPLQSPPDRRGCRNGGAIAILVAPASTTTHCRRLTTWL